MKLKMATYLGLLLYVAAMSTISVLLDFDLWVVVLLLLLIPTGYLFWYLRPPSSIFLPTALSTLASTVLFEAVAYSSGLWYELSAFDFRVLGIFPIEILFWNFILQLFIIAIYEYFVDDKKINQVTFNWNNLWLLGFLVGITAVGLIFATTLSRFVLPYALWWLLVGVIASLAGAMVLSHRQSWSVIKKAVFTTLLISPFLLMYEAVAVFNLHWVFANPAQYLYSLSLFNEIIPVERFVFMFIIPIWMVIVYESYLDDGK